MLGYYTHDEKRGIEWHTGLPPKQPRKKRPSGNQYTAKADVDKDFHVYTVILDGKEYQITAQTQDEANGIAYNIAQINKAAPKPE